MAATTETILLQVDIQTNNQRLVELQKQLLDNKAALAAVNQAFKDGKLSSDELAAAQVRLKQASANVAQEQRVLTAANAAQQKATQASAGSIEQLRAQLALGTAQYNKLSQAERDGSEAGQKLQASNKAVSDSLKTLEKAVGDTRRNVGNYNEGIKDVNVVNGQLTGGLKSAVDKGLSPFRAEIDRGTGLLGKFKSGSDLVSQGLASIKGAGEAGSLGLKAIAGGIALTGIGFFVIALSAVVTYFTQTAEGGKVLAGVLGGLGSVLQVATDIVSGFGKTLVEAVKNPRQALTELVQVLEDQVINRFKSFAVIFNAIRNGDTKQLANGFLQLGSGIEDATGKAGRLFDKTKAAYDLGQSIAVQEKALAKQRRDLEKEDIVAQSRVTVLLRLSKERGKTASEQLTALKEAGTIENELSANRIKQSEKELALVNDRIKSAGAAKKGELIIAKQAKEVEILQASAQQDETNARIRVRESVFKEKLRADASAAAQKGREDAVKAQQTLAEQLLLGVEKGSAAELAVRQRLVQLAANAEIASAKKTAAEKRLIQAKADVDIQNLATEYQLKQLEIAKKRTDEQNKEVLREYKDAEKLLLEYLTDKRAAIEKQYAQGLIGENEYQKQINALENAGLQAALVNAGDYNQSKAALIKAGAELEIKEATRVKNERRKIEDTKQQIIEASLQAGLTASDALVEGLGKETAAGQAALAIRKTLALAEIGISVEKQLVANALAGAKISESAAPLTVPLGIAYTVATDALAVAGGLASAAKILGFNTGGLVPGVGNTDTVPAMLTPGEVVMSAPAVQQFAPVLSYLNVLAGGASFAPGLPQQRGGQADGGLVARALGAAPAMDYQQLAHAIAQQPLSVDVRAIAVQQGRVARARSLTTLGS